MQLQKNNKIIQNLSSLLGLNILDTPIFYENKYALRFDLQSNGSEVSEISLLAEDIFNDTFLEEENISILLTFYLYKTSDPSQNVEFIKMIEDFKFNESDLLIDYDLIPSDPDEDYKYKMITIFNVSNKDLVIKKLQEMSIKAERGGYRGYNPGVYFISEKKKIIFNIYDDRGLDIASSEVENIKRLYGSYKSNLLSFDIEKMRSTFE